MKTFEEDLKPEITLEFIKDLCELAEGFKIKGNIICLHELNCAEYEKLTQWILFPLLLHRAVEGWNNQNQGQISIYSDYIEYKKYSKQIIDGTMESSYDFKDYQPCHLTPCEMAILDCLPEVLK